MPVTSAMSGISCERIGPLLVPWDNVDTKDPCPVFDGHIWHIYGSIGSSQIEQWSILHATAEYPLGPWTEQPIVTLKGVEGPHVAAPSVVFDDHTKKFHMFVQTDFMALDTKIEHLVSDDGSIFHHADTALASLPLTSESGIYDPHTSVIHNELILTYSGCTVVSRPDIYIACSESDTWNGPWKRLGRILAHEEVHHHNQHGHEDYEWGLEGSQLIQLAPDIILLIAVCFLPEEKRGQRQRVFFAASHRLTGPYRTLGPVLTPITEQDWESGENGHAAGVVVDDVLHLFYQARSLDEQKRPWRYGIATFTVDEVVKQARNVLRQEVSVSV